MEPVLVEQFFLGCLAHASYVIASQGEAAVIDPQRDVEIYLELAREKNLKIRHIIETHLHADFVSGHHELAQRTGARIYLGAGSGARFDHVAVRDGDSVKFGDCRVDFLQTPGHTLESICAVMTDLGGGSAPKAVFTGDTLFVGDVGRPDLSPSHTPQQLAAMLYDSLHKKLMNLPDATEVFPAHGAGSLCGRQMSTERSSTIGREKKSNYALQARSCDEFIHLLTDSLPARPEYFVRDVELNRDGAASLDRLPPLVPVGAKEVVDLQKDGVIVLDTRPIQEFAVGHVPGSIHIALGGQFASWAGRLLGLDRPIVLVAEDPEKIRESQLRLARVGIEKVVGFVEDGVTGWVRGGLELDSTRQISVQELGAMRSGGEELMVLDVREPGEVESGALEGSLRIPLGELMKRTTELDRRKAMVVHCKGGYRSSIATSILQRDGFAEVMNLTGGFDAWRAAGH